MQSGHPYLNSVIAMIAIAVAGQLLARAQNASLTIPAPISTAASAPGDSPAVNDQQHWHGFLKLAAKPDAVVTAKDLEEAYGQKPAHRQQAGFYNYYSIKDFVTLFPDGDEAARKRYPNQSSIFASFYFFGGNNPETCITRAQAIRELQRIGWRLYAHSSAKLVQGDIKEVKLSNTTPASDTLLKGDKGIVYLSYPEKTECIGSVRMKANKLEFDQITHGPASKDDP